MALEGRLMDLSHEQDQYTAKVKENQQKVKHFKNQVKVEGCGSGAQHAGHTAIQYLTMGSSCSLTSLLSLPLPLLSSPPSLPPSPSPSLSLSLSVPLPPSTLLPLLSSSLYASPSPLSIPLPHSLPLHHSISFLPPSLSLSVCVRYRWPNSTLRIPL